MSIRPPAFPPAAVRAFLLAHDEVREYLPDADQITTRETPREFTRPVLVLRAQSTVGPDPMLRRPIVQATAVCPRWEILGGDVDPEVLAWRIAWTVAEAATKAPQQGYEGWRWKVNDWLSGPSSEVDLTRGHDHPLYVSPVRLELKMWDRRHQT